MSSKIIYIFTIVILMSVSGCVGIGMIHSSYKTENISLCQPSDKKVTGCITQQELTPQKLLTLRGSPISDKIVQGYRNISYDNGVREWRGILIFVGLPIPLLAPVGRNTTSYIFDKDKLIEVGSTYSKESMVVCGLGGCPRYTMSSQ